MEAVPRSRKNPRKAARRPMIATTLSSTRFELFMRGQNSSIVSRAKRRQRPGAIPDGSPVARRGSDQRAAGADCTHVPRLTGAVAWPDVDGWDAATGCNRRLWRAQREPSRGPGSSYLT